jgi:predicted  nucleic acid-binding Zn-ribbon protein
MKAAQKQHPQMEHKQPTHIHKGIAYLLGNAGSLILGCPRCGKEAFTYMPTYDFEEDARVCTCYGDKTPLEPIREDELDKKWRPLWRSRGVKPPY